MTTDSIRLAILVARNEISRDPAVREWLEPKIAEWEEQIAAAEERATARRKAITRAAFVFALLIAAWWMGSAP